ncbi:MAG: hypothetical protein OHK0015_40920 [Chloroflexi bacterium OHK40]
MPDTPAADFAPAIARCLAGEAPVPELLTLVRAVLGYEGPATRAVLEDFQRRIEATPGAANPVGLVYGGATKIKGYVFEAPKLPEIRGASALLDWVNESALPRLWGASSPQTYVENGIIYASGGNILAFAPADKAQALATQIERLYTEQTLTATSAAVAATFGLLELRFGRNPLAYWIEEFLRDCRDRELQEELLKYYYPPPGVAADDYGDEALRRRFLNRKTFGELVTVLATMFNRRRDERASHGEVRSLPRFELNPWAVKCQSSDVRPAVVVAQVGSDTRRLSEPSARKLAVGRVVKQGKYRTDLDLALRPWEVPQELGSRSWERRWEAFLNRKGKGSPYARAQGNQSPRPASDVGEIGAASDPRRYIGLIYADGNNIGRLMATLSSPELYYNVSRALTDIATTTVFEALAEHLTPARVPDAETGEPKLVHPFEILTIGGDDLLIIVPGNRACDVALRIAQVFEAELTERFRKLGLADGSATTLRGRYTGDDPDAKALQQCTPTVGLSAGVLIAQENTPIFFMRDLVEQLLKGAKKLAKANAAATDKDKQPKPRFYGGAVDFMVLKSTTMVTDKVSAFRKAALNDHPASRRRLTARPYTWAEFAGLLATTRALKQARVPRSQLYRLRRVLDQDSGEGVLTSTMEYLYTRSRQPDRVARVLMQHVEQAWCYGLLGTAPRVGMPPWAPYGSTGYETIWPDLVELAEFVPNREAP